MSPAGRFGAGRFSMSTNILLQSSAPLPAEPSRGPSRTAFLEAARGIAEDLLARVCISPSGGFTWVGPRGYGTELNPLTLAQLRADLYDGVTGVALFFAALAKTGGDPEARAVCLRILAPVRRWLAGRLEGAEGGAPLSKVGVLMGVGSLFYGLLRIAYLIADETLETEALALLPLFDRARIAADSHGRIQSGAAGAIAALLALPPERRGAAVLASARACGERLLELRSASAAGQRAWPISPGKPAQLGFCYGAAGIAWALRRLAEATGEERFLRAAEEGDAFVSTHFSPELENFFDPRSLFQRAHAPRRGTWRDWWATGLPEEIDTLPPPPGPPGPEHLAPVMWCHGAPGIAAGHLASPLRDTPRGRSEIAAGLRAAAAGTSPVADLCCGEAGRIDVLLLAGESLGREDLAAAARAKAAGLIAGRAASGRYEVSAARGQQVFAPTLFQGVAGIGYTFLRCAEPSLPCLLVLE